MKKVLAAVLAFAMVVTGMYFVKPEASEVKAATTVPADMLDVKLQVSNEANKTMRLITSVDSLDYKEVGFIVNNGKDEKKMSTTTVFEKIKSSVGEKSYNFSPKLIGTSSEYFATVKFNVANPDNTYTVQAYVITNDDQEIKGREIRSFQYNDGTATTTVNLLVEGTLTAGVTATYGPNADGTGADAASVTILSTNDGYTSVRVALAEGTTVDDLKSATRFTFSDGTTAVYRNYYTSHINPNSVEYANGYASDNFYDRSWYDVNPTAKTLIIASSADMYGLTQVVNGGKSLQDQTVILVCDVELNPGTANKSTATTAPSWVQDTSVSKYPYQWPLIGSSSNATFRGIFDGDGNEISGLYKYGSVVSLFGFVSGDGVQINNLRLVNSYVTSESWTVGGLINTCKDGTYRLNNVYLDIIVDSPSKYVGGFVAALQYGADVYMNNCWFAGEIYGDRGSSEDGISPFIAYSGAWTHKFGFTNCLNTGKISCYGAGGYGTFAGYMNSESRKYTFTNCVDIGDVTVSSDTGSGNLIGLAAKATSNYECWITISNVYVSNASGRPSAYVGVAPTNGNMYEYSETNLNKVDPSVLQGLTPEQLLEKFPETVTGAGCDWGYANDGTLMPNVFINWYNAR